jgi:hypothetical protein
MGTWKPVVSRLDHPSIIAAYKSGAAVTDIADKHDVKDYHIRSVLKKNGLKIIKGRFKSSYNPHNKSDIDGSQIISLAKSGITFKEISERLNCSIHIVRSRCYAAGVKSPGFCFKEATNLEEQVGSLAYNKLSDVEWLFTAYVVNRKPSRVIASELNCGKKAVLSALRRHKIEVRKGPGNRGRFKSKNQKSNDFWCDSYWEWVISNRLDDDDKVVKFIKNPFPIFYLDKERKQRRYIPDFLVILKDRQILIEVKPDGLLPYVETKIKAANRSTFEFYVMNVDDSFPW